MTAPYQAEKFPGHHGDLARIDPEGAKDGAAPAFGALVEVIEPFLQDLFGQFPGPHESSEDPSGDGEIPPIDRSQKLGAENRHVLGVTRSDEVVTFIGAGPAPHTDIEKEAGRTVPAQVVLHPLQDDLFPIQGKLPVPLRRFPFPRIGKTQFLLSLGSGGVTKGPLSKFDGGIHPPLSWRRVVDGVFFFWFR